jgi:hypothetical protein
LQLLPALATVKVKDTKLESTGPLNYPLGNERTSNFKIISLGAQILHDKNYQFTICMMAMNDMTQPMLRKN